MKTKPNQNRYKKDMEQLTDLISGKTAFIVPNRITLMGIVYEVKVQKTVLSNGKSVNGYINHTDKIIYLKEHNGIDKTFIHEVIHSKDRFFNLRKNVPELEKESLVNLEAEWWVQFFRQIFPVSELFNRTTKGGELDQQAELIKKFQSDIKRKDKQIKKLEGRLKNGYNKKAT